MDQPTRSNRRLLQIARYQRLNEGFSFAFAQKWWGQLILMVLGPKKVV